MPGYFGVVWWVPRSDSTLRTYAYVTFTIYGYVTPRYAGSHATTTLRGYDYVTGWILYYTFPPRLFCCLRWLVPHEHLHILLLTD